MLMSQPLFLECSVGYVLKLLHCVKTKTKSEFRFCFQMVVTGLPERSKNSDSTGSSPEVQKDAPLEARTSQIKSMALVFLLLSLFCRAQYSENHLHDLSANVRV